MYHNKQLIENTIEKNLPNAFKSIGIKLDNEEGKNRKFIASLISENKFIFDIKEFIDDINYIYFEDMINL